MVDIDELTAAADRADWWAQLALAEAWGSAATALEAVAPGAARAAWRFAADAYGVYHDAWRAHLPASRFDHDYGPELAEAERRWRALPASAPAGDLPEWARQTLARRFTCAVAQLVDPPGPPHARALARVLAAACHAAGRPEEAARLAALGDAPPRE